MIDVGAGDAELAVCLECGSNREDETAMYAEVRRTLGTPDGVAVWQQARNVVAEIERLRQRITVLEGTALLNAQPQQEVRQAMGAAYAADAPGRVQSPLINGA